MSFYNLKFDNQTILFDTSLTYVCWFGELLMHDGMLGICVKGGIFVYNKNLHITEKIA